MALNIQNATVRMTLGFKRLKHDYIVLLYLTVEQWLLALVPYTALVPQGWLST